MTTTATHSPNGIILFAHGSRDPLWRGPIEAVAARIRTDSPHLPVTCAYLELCEPSLPDAAAQMISKLQIAINSIAACADSKPATGLKPLKIRIIPMFLGMGKHAREDLPELAAQLRSSHTQVQFEISATVGEDERVTALLAQIALGA
ncbi:CbiX/SirB N-terminal domain-containing protein [Variovorax sp. PCZ-1]|uniref:sirohydrochlorin chelatase n=1 Tax=Variovorax sp. PCZ-1 TaxID=2835533 RepID=UPI001BCC9C92|nr:CbiX/SirB N-terminal domain-containing protein [Variovorax sp. PCZ-1]MBS7807636.1 CbiX/SirB N-terminal domain-containing protein [Variovorax sp. PCZ-1]